MAETFEFIGIPSRVGTTWTQAVTHMAYAIPITTIYQFLEEQRFRFIYDDEFTEEGEKELREKIRKRTQILLEREGIDDDGSEVAMQYY